jgi:hypothetical protein
VPVVIGSYLATRKDRPAAAPEAALAVEEPEVAAR